MGGALLRQQSAEGGGKRDILQNILVPVYHCRAALKRPYHDFHSNSPHKKDGVPTDSWFGVCYPAGGLAPAGIPLVPIQLFEAAGDMALCGVLCLPLYRKTRLRFSVYLLLYGCLRFVTECFRADTARGIIGPLSGAQWISLACIAAGVVIDLGLLVCALHRRIGHARR